MIRLAFDSFRLVLLPTDLLLFLLLFATIGFLLYARRREYYRVAWRQIVARPFEEGKLLQMGHAFEQATNVWRPPKL